MRRVLQLLEEIRHQPDVVPIAIIVFTVVVILCLLWFPRCDATVERPMNAAFSGRSGGCGL